MYNREEILKALKLIQNICKNEERCDTCPFGTDNNYCILQDQSPEDWKIGENTKVWRAFM